MEPDLNLFHLISHFGRFYFALLLVIRPGYFGKSIWLYRGLGLFLSLGACLQIARNV